MVSFDISDADLKIVAEIVKRYAKQARRLVGRRIDTIALQMDLCATHANGNPMDFAKLLGADDFSFAHDVGGIRKNLNRETGKLENFFFPRCSQKEG